MSSESPIYLIEPTENGFLLTVQQVDGTGDKLNQFLDKIPLVLESVSTGQPFQRAETDQNEPPIRKYVFPNYKELEGFLRLDLLPSS